MTPLGIWVFHSDTEFKQNKHEPSIISIALVGTQITKDMEIFVKFLPLNKIPKWGLAPLIWISLKG